MKVVALDPAYWPVRSYGHWCPGCRSGHEINVEPRRDGVKWTFNGDLDRPTFVPSVNIRINMPGMEHYQPDVASSVCHYFITDGKIQFLGDCTHSMKGVTVDLPDLPSDCYVSSQRAARKAGQR